MNQDDSIQNTENTPGAPAVENPQTRAARESERIKELRDRLYTRGDVQKQSIRHALPRHEIHDVFSKPEETVRPEEKKEVTPPPAPVVQEPPVTVPPRVENAVSYSESMASKDSRKSLRKKFAVIGVVFFVVALAVASFIMTKGGNTISGENISITVNGPLTVGGGEEVPFTVSIGNQNTVAIQSATLILEYPKGTQSATENKEIGVVRQALDTIGTGELVNVPVKARIFGKENEEKEIKVSIDYRIAGSNATFHKEAEPLRFKVSTSPVVMTFDTVKSISSGQDVTLTLTIQSNSPTPLTGVLVKASYPAGFDFNESSPETVSGEDIWKIATLKPNEKKVITIKGLMTGYQDEVRQFNASLGIANDHDSNAIASQLATARTEIVIEQPFLDVDVSINGNAADTVIINKTEAAAVEIKYSNNLDFVIYDGKVQVALEGNALSEFDIDVTDGFYDSAKNILTWDGVDVAALKEIAPGRTASLKFTLHPKKDIGSTPEMKLKITTKGQRIFEDKKSQELVGTAARTIKVESVPVVTGETLYHTELFTNTGPLPPVAEKVTQYTFELTVNSGANDITGAEITAVVPQYVSWLDLVTSDDVVTYNTVTRTLKWSIGDMDANTEKKVGIQVSFLPSMTQVGTKPTLLEAQRFKATDRFTGTVVRVVHPALTTTLYAESDEKLQDGKVRATGE
jgi:hypothetical protein